MKNVVIFSQQIAKFFEFVLDIVFLGQILVETSHVGTALYIHIQRNMHSLLDTKLTAADNACLLIPEVDS